MNILIVKLIVQTGIKPEITIMKTEFIIKLIFTLKYF